MSDFRQQWPIRITKINPVSLLISGWDVLGRPIYSVWLPRYTVYRIPMNEISYNYKRQVSMGIITYFVVTPGIEMKGDRYFVRIRTSSIRTGQNRSSADTGVMSSPCPSQGFSKRLCPWPWQTNSGRYYDVPWVVLYGSCKIITYLFMFYFGTTIFFWLRPRRWIWSRTGTRSTSRHSKCNKIKPMNYNFPYVYFTLWSITYGSWITMNFRTA